ncbi:hypothetical protein GCM10010123_23810 [Pilimelia anulata]|uniref:Diguanylate cyclase/phosphodiesterase n=1 Tax=Pilimelia anulata TaxID=53371 RepID=A0A8J3B3L7_9ACTN|nr:EAL domain-containing protein [Pilimelia anulata]GGJ93195.1 hypothetical protein GCM10010123_23810 [Pilimelia anulata]
MAAPNGRGPLWHRVAVWTGVLFVVLGPASLAAESLGFVPNPWLIRVITVPGGLLAAAVCLHVARQPGLNAAARRFWHWSAAAIALVGVGGGINLVDNILYTPNNPAEPSTGAIAAYGIGVLTQLTALLRLPARNRLTAHERKQFVVDGAIMLICFGLFAWRLSFSRTEEWSRIGGGPAALTVVLLAFLAVLAIAKLVMFGVTAVDRRALHTLAGTICAGALIGAVSPLTAGAAVVASTVCITLVGVGFMLAAMFQYAGVGQPPLEQRPWAGTRTAKVAGWLPYLAVAATDGLLIFVVAGHSVGELIVAASAVGLTVIVVYRQVTALRDNSALLRRVDLTVRELRDAQDRLAHQATHDDLTGLANRRLFTERVAATAAGGEPASVALIDLDDFKTINDRLGHHIGDRLLLDVAGRLRSCVRPGDTVSRLGGDEFALLLPGLASEHGVAVLDRITEALGQPVIVDGHALLVRCSAGLAELTADLDPTEVIRRADLAMYAAKEAGKSRYATYDDELDVRINRDAALGAELRTSLTEGHFRLLFQPVVRLVDRVIVGAEALVRWEHPERGTIRPDHFIPVAERTGLIVPLGEWILREACDEAVRWLAEDVTETWTMSVNISARQLREPGFAGTVARVLDETGLPPRHLMIEVTETAVFDSELASAALREISALGVRIALDDFGTGNSSLGLLRTIPVDVLKVDKSFIDHITDSNTESTIAIAMLHLANGLDLGVVAEGVESAAQAARLRKIGYQLSQGYHFARPLPAADVRAMLHTGPNTRRIA